MQVLYLTYDGITSLIGQSQVWPYLKGLSQAGHGFDVISFEHADRRAVIGASVAQEMDGHGIRWHPRNFRRRPPILAKLIDHWDMTRTSWRVAAATRIDFCHARSYVAADVALKLKRRSGVPFVFDMRGFWVDQRMEGDDWPQSNLFYRMLYHRWKAKEAEMVAGAAHIVVLAEAARSVIESWDCYRGQPVTVIPCCIDHEAFPLRTPKSRATARGRLGIQDDATLLVYLGSLGTVYLLDDMLRFFDRLRRRRPGARFLFIGPHSAERLRERTQALGIAAAADDILVRFAEHGGVPDWLAAADLAIGLRAPCFSSLGASPTKLGEYLACGLPVVVNRGVGDSGAIVERLEAGLVLRDMSDAEFDRALGQLDRVLALDAAALRARSREVHEMPVALRAYEAVYDSFASAGRDHPRN